MVHRGEGFGVVSAGCGWSPMYVHIDILQMPLQPRPLFLNIIAWRVTCIRCDQASSACLIDLLGNSGGIRLPVLRFRPLVLCQVGHLNSTLKQYNSDTLLFGRRIFFLLSCHVSFCLCLSLPVSFCLLLSPLLSCLLLSLPVSCCLSLPLINKSSFCKLTL